MNIRALITGVLLVACAGSHAGIILSVDLGTPNTISLTATHGASLASTRGSDTTGFYLASFFLDKTSTIVATRVSGDLTTAQNRSDGTPLLWSTGSNAGLNVWSFTDDRAAVFSTGSRALSGSATWIVDAASYRAAVAGPDSGAVYFAADSDRGIAGATRVGEWQRLTPVDPAAVPAPATLAVAGLGLAVLGWRRRPGAWSTP